MHLAGDEPVRQRLCTANQHADIARHLDLDKLIALEGQHQTLRQGLGLRQRGAAAVVPLAGALAAHLTDGRFNHGVVFTARLNGERVGRIRAVGEVNVEGAVVIKPEHARLEDDGGIGECHLRCLSCSAGDAI